MRVLTGAILLAGALAIGGCSEQEADEAAAGSQACASDDSGITLPPGFCATVFAEDVGRGRHLVVGADGTVYLNTWSGFYYDGDVRRDEGYLVALKDTSGDGKADIVTRFGPGTGDKVAGGTGIAIYKGWLYAEVDDRIIRWHLNPGGAAPKSAPDVIVSGLPMGGEHPMHQFVIDGAGQLFVNSGAFTNACEIKMGVPRPKVDNPCRELAEHAGVWRFDAERPGQRFGAAARYATGIRNIGGMRIDDDGSLVVSQHGRDSLAQNWPAFYSVEDGAELPSEEILRVGEGQDFGWPYCYFDGHRQLKVLAPEYGGDGGKARGRCASVPPPIAHFPGHWAPNDILFYRGNMFPASYREGIFVAFHGSWNRAPLPQQGFKIVFQPMSNGIAKGKPLVFADGFAGKSEPDQTAYRPSGMAVGPDGSLFVSDDNRGRIWRISYAGQKNAAPNAAPPPVFKVAAIEAASRLPLAPGTNALEVQRGRRIFHGEEQGGTCSGCHGKDGKGSNMGPSLASGRWLWSDGSLAGISRTVREGVAVPRKSGGAMPPNGGAALEPDDVKAVSAYVWAIGHTSK